jgi:hypothetical protein
VAAGAAGVAAHLPPHSGHVVKASDWDDTGRRPLPADLCRWRTVLVCVAVILILAAAQALLALPPVASSVTK